MSQPTAVPFTTVVVVWLASILALLMVAVLAVPMAYLLMLFLGNLGLHLSFLACIPGAMMLSSIRSRNNRAVQNGS